MLMVMREADASSVGLAGGGERVAVGVDAVHRDVGLGEMTWFGVGGAADRYVEPGSLEGLVGVVRGCAEGGDRLRVLGKGANLLVADEGVGGVVVKLSGDWFRRVEIDGESGVVRVGAGAELERLVTGTVRAGLGGLEVLAGVPATVGGAIRMNAGGAFGEIGSVVRSVTVMGGDGEQRVVNSDQCGFGYRRSAFRDEVVVGAEFALQPGDPVKLRERLKEVMAYKRDSQPMAASSAGCCFKNPDKDVSEKGAGRLIDEAGLKGLRMGGAEVSQRHANFIVLHEGARADDVVRLMSEVQRRVAERFGVELVREVVVWSRELD